MDKNSNFEDIVKRIAPTLKRITYKLNGHFTFFNHEDLFQEALVHLWQDFQARKLSDKTDSYILQGCYFHLKNHIRKCKIKAKLVSIDSVVDENSACLKDAFYLQDESAKNYFDRLNNKMLAETIRNNGLSLREKDILFLYCDGLTTRQIGSRFGISHVRVVKLLAKIKEKCKKYRDGS
jgi:RNA polymerase sigma factor (sigma-70 family)